MILCINSYSVGDMRKNWGKESFEKLGPQVFTQCKYSQISWLNFGVLSLIIVTDGNWDEVLKIINTIL